MKFALEHLCGAFIISIVLTTTVAFGDETLVNADCSPVQDACSIVTDCTSSSATINARDCRSCLLRAPITGHCIVFGNDPACEAQKAAQRAGAEVDREQQRISCEARKLQSKQDCEARLAAARTQCEAQAVLKGAGPTARPDKYIELFALGGEGDPQPIPSMVTDKLLGKRVYDSAFLASIRVFQLRTSDGLTNINIPAPLEGEALGFAIGNHILVRDLKGVNDLPLKFWLRNIELSRLFTEYGTSKLGQALDSGSSVIFNLINSQVEKNCAILDC
jgi:hypothetical protein